jgi:hypothetical protein
MWMKSWILQDSFQHPEEPKLVRAQVSRIGWVPQSCNVMFVDFWYNFSPIMTHWIIHVHPKSYKRQSRTKIPVFRFSIRKHLIDEILLIKFASFW